MEYMDRYRKLQQFKSLKDFDTNRKSIFYAIKDRLSKGALLVWNELAQRSIDVPGVCWVQIDTLAKSVNVSRSTVERAIRLFKKLGVLQVEQTTRPVKGGDGANVYIFQKLGEGAEMKGRENSEKPCDSKNEPSNLPKDTKIPLFLKNNITKERTVKPAWIPQSFYSLVSAHYSDVETIEEYWRAAYATTYAYNFTQETKTELAIEAFYAMKSKRKKLRNPIGFFTGVMKRKAKKRHIENMFNFAFESDYATD